MQTANLHPLGQSGRLGAVEFKEAFDRPICANALVKANNDSNFSTLIYPKDFIKDNRKFDAALLCYVLQVMPKESERRKLLRYVYEKLKDDAYVLYMSRYNQLEGTSNEHRVEDGFYKWPERQNHSFYREFKTEETHTMMEKFNFKRVRSLGERGTDQIFLYAKGRATWI